MITVNEIVDAIMVMEDADVDHIVTAIRTRREMINLQAKAHFRVGDKVTFFNRKAKENLVGTVSKINRKKVNVKVGRITWSVPPSMLSVVEG